MISCTIRVSEKYANSAHVSIQQEHIELYAQGRLYSILLCHKDDCRLIKEYKGQDLQRLLGSAIERGRRMANIHEYYFLGNR